MEPNMINIRNNLSLFIDKNRTVSFHSISPIAKNFANINLAVMPFHISNILLIILKRNLHKNVFILLANLSVSDLLLQVFLSIIKSHFSKSVHIALSVFHTASILFTLAINLDRYLKVKYGLRYYEIVRTVRLVKAIAITWTFAVFFWVIPMSLINDDSRELATTFKLGFNIFCSILMLLPSMWVVVTRNSHLRIIKQQEDAVAKARYNYYHYYIGIIFTKNSSLPLYSLIA